jgi:hypothetical protein
LFVDSSDGFRVVDAADEPMQDELDFLVAARGEVVSVRVGALRDGLNVGILVEK